MADKEKKKKKKTKEEGGKAEDAGPEPASESKEEASEKKRSTRSSSKKAKRTGSTVFSMFSQGQIAEFKEGFSLMDMDKDGIIGKQDLSLTFDKVGKLVNDKDLDEMLGEAPGPINFTQLLTLFAQRMSGGADEDDVIIKAFKAFDEDGVINGEKLKHALMTWGDKFSRKEIADAYEAMDIDDKGNIDTESVIQMLTGAVDDD